mmetsp:Transcript_33062/g.32189  ORF Transcript_33062/g.32189 Transcript_33062/m.32189 type:complete len:172 (+) Transcript_33062:914-1429(+)|eukprot:CAMPEP_0170556228 /NCGR_PEP_ID=MMETSP0211-20121228/15786_1 /TAXON_ID=311385 /ORGANISM="Pseudokeronopsis sp., Strain OXSARD2" /LENGTH=171 /DNA_ID=CAMNT_0010866425 /DNA_START=884 /DNA_END=1399 /DNA_ORIENTATION=-
MRERFIYNASVPGELVSDNFKSFTDVFGDVDDLLILFSADTQPHFKLNQGFGEITADMTLHVANPMNIDIDAAIVKCSFVGKVDFKMQENFTLISTFTDIDLTPTGMEIYFKSKTKRLGEIVDFVEGAKEFFLDNMNSKLGSKGLSLPMPASITEYIGNIETKIQESFIVI